MMSFNIIIKNGTKREQIRRRFNDVNGYLKKELRSPSERKGEVSDFSHWSKSKSTMGNSQNGMLMKEKSDIFEDFKKKGVLKQEKPKEKIDPIDKMKKDEIHRLRKFHVEDLKNGLMSEGQMMRGHSGDGNEDAQTQRYINWKDTPWRGSDGRVLTNAQRMEEWGKANKAFKVRGEEGRIHNFDHVRTEKFQKRKVRYD